MMLVRWLHMVKRAVKLAGSHLSKGQELESLVKLFQDRATKMLFSSLKEMRSLQRYLLEVLRE